MAIIELSLHQFGTNLFTVFVHCSKQLKRGPGFYWIDYRLADRGRAIAVSRYRFGLHRSFCVPGDVIRTRFVNSAGDPLAICRLK